jgi:hypothetical protein
MRNIYTVFANFLPNLSRTTQITSDDIHMRIDTLYSGRYVTTVIIFLHSKRTEAMFLRNVGTYLQNCMTSHNINTTKRITQTLIDAGKEAGPEVNTEKTKYMLLSPHQNVGQNHDIQMF